MGTTVDLIKAVNLWPLLIFAAVAIYRSQLKRLLESLIKRVEGGDEITIATWVTLGKSTGPLKVPSAEAMVTDDHIALIHRSWRRTDLDAKFGGMKMYQIHVILFGQKAALDRVEYVLYELDPAYPHNTQASSDRENAFQLKELANGYSLIRAVVKIKDQSEVVHLSRFIDLTVESPKLKGEYF